MFLLIIGLLLFVGLVIIHEFGHFIMARRNGVEIEEFGLGFPPKLFKKRIKSKKGDFNFTINLLPLGGFVKLKGEHDDDTEPGTYGAAPLLAKTKIMAAGVIMNLLVAYVLLVVLCLIGIPKLIDNQYTVSSDTKIVKNEVIINFVEKDSPAAKAGLKTGDNITYFGKTGTCDTPAIDKQSSCSQIKNFAELKSSTTGLAGQRLEIVYQRDGQEKYATAQLRSEKEVTASQKTDNPKGYLGVGAIDYTIRRNTWSAPVVAGGLIGQFTGLTYQGLGRAVGGVGSIIAGAATGNGEARKNGQTTASSQVSGPLGIFFILKDGGSFGFRFILMVIAVISLTLAIMNILPIPALDGGRLWLTLITRGIFKRPLTQKREETINAAGFLFLMGLIVLITIVDVRRFF